MVPGARVKVGTRCKGQGWYQVQGSRLSARVKVGTWCKGQGPIYGRGGAAHIMPWKTHSNTVDISTEA